MSRPVLAYYNSEKSCTVEMNASDEAIAGVISQPDGERQLHLVAYYSKKLHSAELNCDIYEKEMMAIIEAFKEWRRYLECAKHKIKFLTDPKNLEHF